MNTIKILNPEQKKAFFETYSKVQSDSESEIEIAGFPVNTIHPHDGGKTVLHMACIKGNEHVLMQLIQMKAVVDIPDDHGNLPLHWAVKYGTPNMCHTLLKVSQSSINAKDSYGQTPLMLACWKGTHENVEVLLRSKALDDNKKTLVEDKKAYNDEIRTLVDETDHRNQTAMHLAAQRGHYSCVKLLLEKKASLSILTTLG